MKQDVTEPAASVFSTPTARENQENDGSNQDGPAMKETVANKPLIKSVINHWIFVQSRSRCKQQQ
jgi:hypothetical protein